MLHWLIKKRMSGGLDFGPPAWRPERIEDTFDAPAPDDGAPERRFPETPEAQAALLERLGITRTSAIIPPLAAQLRAAGEPSMLVLNLLPTQPEFALAGALSHLAIADLAAGLGALADTICVVRIVIDRHDHRLQRLWKNALRENFPASRGRIRIRALVNRYPQADPTVLIRRLTGRRLPVGDLPPKVGILLVDPVACWALGRFLRTGQGLTDRPVQLFAQGAGEPRLVLGRIGEPLHQFCARHHANAKNSQVILNGMLAGREIDPSTARIDAATESITLRGRPAIEVPSACIACGWCVDVCPTALQPIRLLQLAADVAPDSVRGAAETGRILASREAHEALHCIGCGLCSYVCPTRLPLMAETLRLRSAVIHAGEKQ